MRKRVLWVALAAVTAGCASNRASEPGAAADNMRTLVVPVALQPPPVYALIGYRDRIKLTSQQVTTLDSIAEAVREQNSALVDELRDKAVVTNRAPGVLQVNPSEKPILDQIRSNNRQVLDQVGSVLSAEQKTEVCGLYEPDRPEQQPRQRRRDPQDEFMRDRSARADSSRYVRGFSVWPWCQSQSQSDTTTVR